MAIMHWVLTIPSLKSFYEKQPDDLQREWRRIGAIEKAANVVDAISATGEEHSIGSLLEVGAGTGAILDELSGRIARKKFVGIDVGRKNKERGDSTVTPQGNKIIYFDGIKIPFEDSSFDFVYASHVLEHVVDERSFICELRRVSRRWVYVEVPCEITVRTSPSSLQVSLNIGHINAFTPESFALRLETSGLRVKRLELRDVSFATIRFNKSILKASMIFFTRRIAFMISPRIASRFFVFHAGALCEKGKILDL